MEMIGKQDPSNAFEGQSCTDFDYRLAQHGSTRFLDQDGTAIESCKREEISGAGNVASSVFRHNRFYRSISSRMVRKRTLRV